jgi:hypothetical protein
MSTQSNPTGSGPAPLNANGGVEFLLSKRRKALLRPPRNLEEILQMALAAWRKVASKVSVSGASPEALEAMLLRVRQTRMAEQEVALHLTAAKDARRVATDRAYRKLLALSAASRREGRTEPEVEAAFAPLWRAIAELHRKAGVPAEPEKPLNEAA